ncbi:MAG: c-type cytochrome [Rhodoferax sp.]|uniref:c-type cytochrome n=1 Tax=Rhodoferax sp. TaxID=50421 RepID=UPI00140007E5|nr:c-type cytochrome [Rhodoferax sp.]NDP37685.1 c-type cytochrome [Rhodoferax sp.]
MALSQPIRQDGPRATSIGVSLLCRTAGTALFTALALTVLPALAQTGEKIAKSGNAAGAPACVTCHGATGQGQPAAGFPRLAGLNAAYFLRQLQSFHDATRVNPIMAPVVQQLSATDRQALAEYYAGLAVTNHDGQPPADTKSLSVGESLAQRGDWNKGLPACAQCHGLKGLGVGAAFPQIAGQSPAYIVTQLKAWQTGTRKNDPLGLMHGIALKLSPTDIGAVAVYYGSLDAAPSTKRSVKP